MPLNLTWQDVALRLLLAVVAGAVIGFNREERSQAVGVRTTVLVCLSAASPCFADWRPKATSG